MTYLRQFIRPQFWAVKRAALIAGTLLIAIIAVLICLIPKPENDLFFELRIGSDILSSHHLPHFDIYSWVNRGTRWDVPEWLAFVLYALAFRAGGFFGTWLLMALLTVAATGVVWFRLTRSAGLAGAFLMTTLMLLAMKDGIQERPYAFTYLLLAVSLLILIRAREGRPRLLFWLPPLCALWTNLHQGVLALILLLLVYALGDAISAGRLRRQGAGAETVKTFRVRAWLMLGTAAACIGAGMVSPYGWRVYWNVLITLRNHNLMANVTEWNPVTVLPFSQLQPFLAITALAFGILACSRRRFSDALVVAALLGQALLHARNIPLFAIGSVIIIAPHFTSAVEQIRRALGLSPTPVSRPVLLSAFALLFVAAVALVSFVSLRRAIGPRGYSRQGLGEAVAGLPGYPENACAFMQAERFPPHLRLLNGFETGGFLMWRLPSEPVFIDGRLDVYVGQTFDKMLILARHPGSPAWAALVQQYDFDCVMTTSKHEANAFAADPQWQLVYTDPKGSRQHCRVLLRRRSEFAGLIARCLHDRPLGTKG